MAASFAEVAEGVRAAIAAYTHAIDDGRSDDVVATFCPDGSCDIPGLGAFSGEDELRAGYGRWQPPVPMRHLVVNTLVTSGPDDGSASAVSDVVVLVLGDKGWKVQIVGRYRDDLHRADDGAWRFHRRVAEFVSPPT